MKKMIKRLSSLALTLAITASSAISMSVSANIYLPKDLSEFSDFNVIDDKGMLKNVDEYKWIDKYKILYKEGYQIHKANPQYNDLQFVLSEDVNYEEVNDRVVEIFKEFYPNGITGPLGSMSPSEYDEYIKNFKPELNFKDFNHTYTITVDNRSAGGIYDIEKIEEAKKTSKALMKKLNDEKLISAFYDFGEVYMVSTIECSSIEDLGFSLDADIDLIDNYIKEHNIDCTIEKDYYRTYYPIYKLKYNDDTDFLEHFSNITDIYEATSIKPASLGVLEDLETIYGKNSLEDLTKIIGDVDGDGKTNISDAAFIARKVAQRKTTELTDLADYNDDGICDIRDAAAIARDVAKRIL